MIANRQPTCVSLSHLVFPLKSRLRRLSRRESLSSEDGAVLAEVGRLLESLPLSGEEFSLSSNRLRNAERYLQAAERGAAHWELELLRRVLQRWLEERPNPDRVGRAHLTAD